MKNRCTGFELPDHTERSIEIHRDVAPLEVTLAVSYYGPEKVDQEIVKNWVKKVRALYYTGKKASKKVVIGLVAETGEHYKNGETSWYRWGRYEEKNIGAPIHLLQICIGGEHVLFYYSFSRYDKFPRCLADLLTDFKTVVAAVGMKALEERMAKQFNLSFPRTVDLSRLAAHFDLMFVKPDGYDSFSVMKLAREVYRDGDAMFDLDYAWLELGGKGSRGRGMRWWESEDWRNDGSDRGTMSEEKLKTGTLQAFLVHAMAVKLLRKPKRIFVSRHFKNAVPVSGDWVVR